MRVKLSVIVTAVTVGVMGVLGVLVTRNIQDSARENNVASLDNQNRLVVDLLSTTSELLKLEAEKAGHAFKAHYPGTFALDTRTTIMLDGRPTPELRHDGTRVNGDYRDVDAFTRDTGGDVATVFARSGDDLIRVATSLANENGVRAVATRLERTHPGYARLMHGEPYLGIARLFGTYYMTKYWPIKDRSGSVIGVLFIGMNLTDSLSTLGDKIRTLGRTKSNYVGIIDAAPGSAHGTIVLHPTKKGTNGLLEGDPQARRVIKEMIDLRQGTLSYQWINAELGEAQPREKFAVLSEFKDWNWIVASTSSAEALEGQTKDVQRLFAASIVLTAAAIILGLNLAIGRLVISPLLRMQDGVIRSHAELHRLNRMYQVLTACNTCLVSATSEKSLLDSICARLIDIGGFRLAWVGFAEADEACTVRPAAQASTREGYLESIRVVWADTEYGQGPVGTAIREQRLVVERNLQTSPRFAPWRTAARRHGLASAIALPLMLDGTVCLGALTIYSVQMDAFDADETKLLVELASNLAHGIQALRDRVARGQAQRALLVTAERLQHLSEASPTILYSLQPCDGMLLPIEVSDNVARILGYAPAEALESGWWFAGLHPEDREAATAASGRVLTGEHVVHEYRFAHRDGGYLWFRDEMRLTWDTAGRPKEVVGAWTDITERKSFELGLERERNFFETLIRTLPDLVWLKDPQSTYIMCNSRFARMYGVPEDGIRGKTDYDFVDKEQADFFHANDRAAMAAGGPTIIEEELTFANDGHRELVEVIKTPMFDGADQLIGVLCIGRDVTASRRSQAALQESEERFRDLVDNIDDLICTHDLQGRILFANPSSARSLGYALGELLGMNMRELMAQPYQVQFEAYLANIQHNGSASGVMAIRTKSGERRLWKYHNSLRTQGVPEPIVRGLAHDITVEMRAEQALRESEARYRALFEHLQSGFALHEVVANDAGKPVDYLFLAANNTYGRITDREPSEIVGMRVSEVFPQPVFDWVGLFGNVALTGRSIHLERHVEVARRWYELTAYQPAPGQVAVVVQDITERKRAEAAVLESDARHRTVLSALGEGVYGVNHKGRCTFINRAASAMLGVAEQDVLGQDLHTLFHHHGANGQPYPHANCPIVHCLRDGLVRRLEEWFFDRDGNGFPVEMVVSPIADGDGRRGAVVAFRDISARRRAEDDLRKLSLAVEQSPESVVITDLDARIEYVNEAFLRNTGYVRDEVIGKNPRVLHSGNTPAATYQDLWATLADGLPWKGEFFNRRKDGSEYVELAIVAPIRQPDGRISHYLAVKEDITERKRIAAELNQHRHHLEKLVSERTAQLGQARERAESANRAKSAFLATMSHELRTPMNGVLGMIDLLHQSELNPDQRDMMGTVSESAHSLLGIIDDILDFSKIEAGKLNLDMVPVSIAQVVEGVAETLAPIALKKNVELLLFCDPGIPQWVRADPVRLRQVLFNLAGNAVKFTGTEDGKAGKVVIRADLEESAGKKILVRMRVIDNGIGMSEDSVAKLFQPFMQAENSTTRRFGGTGLGLSISMRLAHLMGGAIEVHSTPGVGSSFSVAFEFEGAQGTPAAVPQFDLAKLAVVVFAPGENLREILVRYLEHSGAQVLAAQQPDDAVKHASAAMRTGIPWVVVVADVGRDTAFAAALRNRFSDAPELAGTRFVMIERGRRHTARLQGPDCVSLDANAMGRRALQQAVAVAAGRASPEPREDQAKRLLPASRLPSIDEAEAAGRLILAAEDNKTNQKVIERQLHLLGYAVQIAGDGQEALLMWQRRRYGLVLTDCHMPNMDGFELTAALRREQDGSGVRTPIIAITANALKGEDQRCLAAGMDDYLSKPVQLVALRDTVARWLPAGQASRPLAEATEPAEPSAAAQAQPQPLAAAVNPDALKEIVGDDPAVVAEFLSDFVITAGEAVAELQAAYAKRGGHEVGAVAHKLKSSARTVGADALADLCLELEQAGKTEDWTVIDTSMSMLAPCFEAVERFIGTFVGQGGQNEVTQLELAMPTA
ncbi:MAG: PAS domain S-box protein [Sterolibacteriaceae bacterium]|uniref:Sensory/regulatory protein RpfC n=1 Tax=Candidatus Methylophosphatis roskildensis TaxID=2899263 RepID=A0A9D7E3D3_9PROT|nr:PAS domain S-box protein [Candidatus Methylophosphatis roskildensis]